MEKKTDNKIFKELDELILRYKKADKEYWESMYDLEQYVQLILCHGDMNGHVEVLDNCLQIRVKKLTLELFELKALLSSCNVPYEYENNDNDFFLKFDLWNISSLSESEE